MRVKRGLGAKCKPSINRDAEGFKGINIPQIHVNDHLLDICFHKSIPFFSGTSPTTRKHICNLEPFSVRETSRFEVFDTRDRELVPHHDVYA